MITVKKAALALMVMGYALGSQSAWALEKVRLAQNLAPISALSIIAKQQGLFEKYGLDVDVINTTSGRQALEAVLGGSADIATTAEAPTTAAAFAGQKIAFLARTEYSDLKTLTLSGSGINTLADLKGKRLGYAAGTGSEVYTWTLLRKAGLSNKDVTLVNLRPQDMVAAAASGSIDAYDIFEPYVSNGKRVLGDKVRQLDTRGVYSETFNIVTQQSYLAAHPAVAQNFLHALLDAETWIAANREEAVKRLAKTVGMTEPELNDVWDDFVFHLVLDQRVIDTLTAHAQWRLETGNAAGDAKQIPDLRALIFAAPLKAIAPDRVTLSATQ
ncbi:NrtA/SsuA/CpmA family ABC transporter substrate-binding protein [Pseudomonas sp. RC10]|uniref:ABC transporter substrate-binding protein n=1 Tax=Pseudomonas bambusae TaxID=3139142 RepID=UPI00313A3207